MCIVRLRKYTGITSADPDVARYTYSDDIINAVDALAKKTKALQREKDKYLSKHAKGECVIQ